MCIRDSFLTATLRPGRHSVAVAVAAPLEVCAVMKHQAVACLLYTSDAADERSSVDLGGRRIIKKKNKYKIR